MYRVLEKYSYHSIFNEYFLSIPRKNELIEQKYRYLLLFTCIGTSLCIKSYFYVRSTARLALRLSFKLNLVSLTIKRFKVKSIENPVYWWIKISVLGRIARPFDIPSSDADQYLLSDWQSIISGVIQALACAGCLVVWCYFNIGVDVQPVHYCKGR